jgi:predicted ArsR family transcriptional regulator
VAEPRWDQRFFSSTRGQIVELLRRSTRTVDELAAELELTDNAVRAHLAALERDGLIHQQGLRRGERRPAYIYSLTPEAENLFARAYEPMLSLLLDVLDERLAEGAIEGIMREVGRRLAAEHEARDDADPRARIRSTVAILEALGGSITINDGDGKVTLRGNGCLFARLTPDHPSVCRLAETLIEELVGKPVSECCEREGERPHCRFEVSLS